jgi:tetratricopeptide (TPR) repeat protein
MKSAPNRSSDDRARRNWLGGLLLLAFAVYANTLAGGFLFDDHFQIQQNPYLRGFGHLGKVLTTPVWSFQGSQGLPNFYRPVMTFGYWVCHHAFDDSPLGYHLVSVLLHVAVVGLVFALALELFQEFRIALLAGVVFALHPIHTESVAWIAGVTDVEMTLFFLLAFWCYLRLGDTPSGAIRLRVAMLVCSALALLSKESAIVLPAVAAIYEHGYRPMRADLPLTAKIRRYAPLWILAAAYLIFRRLMFGALVRTHFHADLTWPQTALSGLALLGQYAGKFLWPWPLCFYYPFHKSTSLAEPYVVAGALVILLSAAAFLVLWRHARIYSFALLWIFVTVAIVLNARWMTGTVFAERYWYLPSVGACWLLGAGIVALWSRLKGAPRSARALATAAALAVGALAASATVLRNRDWKSDRTLCLQTLAVRPRAAHFRVNLAAMDWSAGKRDLAEREWRAALAEDPRDPMALWDMGMAASERKSYAEALDYLNRSTAVAPQYSTPYLYRGHVYQALGRPADAEREFEHAVAISPNGIDERNALGLFLRDAGRPGEAAAQFQASVARAPNVTAWTNLAQICEARRDLSCAERDWQQVLALETFNSLAHLGLGRIALAQGRWQDAAKQFQSALLMDPHNAGALAGLARAEHGKGGPRP